MHPSSATRRAFVRAAGRLAVVSTMAAMMILTVVPVSAHPASAANIAPTYSTLTRIGSGSLGRPQSGFAAVGNPEIQRDAPGGNVHSGQASNASRTATSALAVPNPTPNAVAPNNKGASGFAGLDHYQNRTASNGNQFSLEPPDQGLCEGRGLVMEPVNDVLAVYSAESHAMVAGPTALNAFFGLAPAINRTTGKYGPFLSDPRCFYDQPTNRWFVTILYISTNPNTGAFEAPTYTLIGVSTSGNVTGAYNIYALDTTDAGGPSCPCFGDQPLLGLDQTGLYISTNEFPLFANGFNGAQIYAMSKWALAAGAKKVLVAHFDASQALVPYGGLSYSVQPATTPPGGEYATVSNGTEYFLSALQFTGVLDNRIATWAMTGTKSLNSKSPSLALQFVVISSEVYGQPNPATQKAGNYPLGQTLGQPLELLNTNDDRMNQVVYSRGLLYSGLNTLLAAGNTGVAYFIVKPALGDHPLTASMDKQGYVSVLGANVFFPSIGVTKDGQAVMTATLSGPTFYPSSIYVRIKDGRAGNVHISGAGAGPEDGFTGYAQYGGNGVARWGDYSAAFAGTDGNVWVASEYIGQTCTVAQYLADNTCGGTRTQLANWGTFITRVNPWAQED